MLHNFKVVRRIQNPEKSYRGAQWRMKSEGATEKLLAASQVGNPESS